MKGLKHLVRNSANVLYIPHGSDESWYKAYLRKFNIKLYIPHGSDESYWYKFVWSFKITLYPTWFRWKLALRSIFFEAFFLFISHMVQMKATTPIKKTVAASYFISHMVQMKVYLCLRLVLLLKTLYPTWFRWKRRSLIMRESL